MIEILETFYELFKTVIFVLVMAFLIRYFIFQPFMVQGISMEPNLHDSQYLIVDRLSYKISKPDRGDVIVFDAPNVQGVEYIKRVIGLPGDKIEIKNNQVYVNDKILEEKYLPNDYKTLIEENPDLSITKQVGNDEYFVMGDNRGHSMDSRIFGVIKKQAIVGRALFILYPLEYFGKVYEPSY